MPQFAGVAAGGGGGGAAHTVSWGHVDTAATWEVARPIHAAGLHMLLQADLWASKQMKSATSMLLTVDGPAAFWVSKAIFISLEFYTNSATF